jgi:hypothetical protein
MGVFPESEVVYDGGEDREYCPRCGEGGYLADMEQFPSKEQTERLRGIYTEGRRVELVKMEDPYTKLRPGDKGTIDHVDDGGGIHIKWDSGSSLAAIWGEDEVLLIN